MAESLNDVVLLVVMDRKFRERKTRAVLASNGLAQSWPEITRLACEDAKFSSGPAQAELL